ncbi:hypothetical protein [Streptomyces sp. NPDC047981]
MPTGLREHEDDHVSDGASVVSFPEMTERIAAAFPQLGRERL